MTSSHRALSPDLRSRLAKVVLNARCVAEAGACHALEALAVDPSAPHKAMSLRIMSFQTDCEPAGGSLEDAARAEAATPSTRNKEATP